MAAASSAPSLNVLVRESKGSLFRSVEGRFLLIVALSVLIHLGLIFHFYQIKQPARPVMDIEQIPERFARLIIEKPIPKKAPEVKREKQKPTENPPEEVKPDEPPKISGRERKKAQQAVAARAARVEKKVRSVGVLGMLTGVGTTAKGPSVVDVLGAMRDHKETDTDLDDALEKLTGLQQAGDVEVLQRKLVRSKDVSIEYRQDIDDLVESIGSARSIDLVKRGEFIIQKPESIEGAASSNTKRDNSAIGAVVSRHKTSIRMSYEKFLKRHPGLAGKVTVRFTIAASGIVSSVSILENSTGNSDLETEIVRKVRMWRFASIDEGDVTVTYPFVFMPSS